MLEPFKKRGFSLRQQQQMAVSRLADRYMAWRLRGVTWQQPAQSKVVESSVLTLDEPRDVPEYTYVDYGGHKTDGKQIITTGGPESQPRSLSEKAKDLIRNLDNEDRIVIAVCTALVIFIVVVFSIILGDDGEVIDTTSPEYRYGYSDGARNEQRNQWLNREYSGGVNDSLYSHCDRSEGGDQGVVLYDPQNDTCYFGSQIPAHMSEINAKAEIDAKNLKTATSVLNRLAEDRGIKADDSWRMLAEEFALTSPYPQAREAALQAYVAHGGDKAKFSPRIAKGGTPSSAQSDIRVRDCIPNPEPNTEYYNQNGIQLYACTGTGG